MKPLETAQWAALRTDGMLETGMRRAQKDATGDAEIVYRTARAMRLRWNTWEKCSDRMFLVVKSLRGTYRQLLGV